MFRIKDHIISLVAVFLALGLGILIGTGMSDDMIVTQQRLLIEQMSEDYKLLRAERQTLEERLQAVTQDLSLWQKYQEALYPGIVSGSLTGKKISILCYGTEIPHGVLTLLQDAEASICSIIHIDGRDVLETEAGLGASLATLAVGEPLTPDVEQIIKSFIDENKVRVDTYLQDRPEAVILVLGGRQSVDKKMVNELIGAFNRGQYSIVGLENRDVTDSVLQEVKAAGFSTIDNADTVFGQFSLLSVLLGSEGNYGIKTAADQFMATF